MRIDDHNPFLHGAVGSQGEKSKPREINDYYATHPMAAEELLQLAKIDKNIWECACGEGNLSKVFIEHDHNVKSTDLIYRGFGEGGIDFLKQAQPFDGDIVTNPPYKYAKEFIEHALELIPEGKKVCMFLKVQFLEGRARKEMFLTTPLKEVWISAGRIPCSTGGGEYRASMIAYAWYIWEKGYKGNPTLHWFN